MKNNYKSKSLLIVLLLTGSISFSQVGINTVTPQSELDVNGDVTISRDNGKLILSSDNGNTISINAPNASDDYELVLPTDDGNFDQLLSTDGNGNLQWRDINFTNATVSSVLLTSSAVPSRDFSIPSDAPSGLGDEPGGLVDVRQIIDYSEILSDPLNNFDLAADTYEVPEDGFYLVSLLVNPNSRPGRLNFRDDGNYYPVSIEIFNSSTGEIILDTATIRYDTENNAALRYSVSLNGLVFLNQGDTLTSFIRLRGRNKQIGATAFDVMSTAGNTESIVVPNRGIVFPRQFSFAVAIRTQAIWSIVRI